MAIFNLSAKATRIVVWVLDAIVFVAYSGQAVFGYTLPDVSPYIAILVAVLSAVFGIFWQPKT